MTKIFMVLPEKMYELGMIKEDEADMIRYGIELLSIKLSHYCLIYLLAYLLLGIRGVIVTFVFTVPYVYLRSITGGYHSKSKIICLCISLILVVFLILNITILQNIDLTFSCLIATILVWLKSPIECENAPLSSVEIDKLRKKIVPVLIAYNAVSIGLTLLGVQLYANLIKLSIIVDAIFILIDKLKNAMK